MTITWYGETCFLISGDGARCVINPPKKSASARIPKGKADVIVFSNEPDHTEWERLKEKDTVVITSPGEYDVRDFFIMMSPPHITKEKPAEKHDAIILVQHSGRRFCHISNYTHDAVDEEDLEYIGTVDILMLPIGKQSVKIAHQIEPAVVIPTVPDQNTKEGKKTLQSFLKELGASDVQPESKFTIKKKDSFSDEHTDVVLLEANT